jgi:hypothetical protein
VSEEDRENRLLHACWDLQGPPLGKNQDEVIALIDSLSSRSGAPKAALRIAISRAVYNYYRDLFAQLPPLTAQERDLLLAAAQLLEDKRATLLSVLRKDHPDSNSEIAREDAWKRLPPELPDDLRKCARFAPLAPTRREAHRPSQTAPFRALTLRLIDYWEKTTGKSFKPYFVEQGVAGNRGTGFVWDIINYVDPEALPSLSYIMKSIVADRRPERTP